MVSKTLAFMLIAIAIQSNSGCIYQDSFGNEPKTKEETCGSEPEDKCIESFESMDLNQDGLVTCQEVSVAILIG